MPPPESAPPIRRKVDIASLLGLSLAVAAITGGLLLEGGKIHDVVQITAALIVLGGTFGAVLVTCPLPVVTRALKKLPCVFIDKTFPASLWIDTLVGFASSARRSGLTSLEDGAKMVSDPFLRKALRLAADGTAAHEIREIMDLEIAIEEQTLETEAKVFEAAGGYSPTVGIIGAVLGLIQVMKHLENIDEVGRGIAVAFVATVYGVAAANLFLLPAANKLKARSARLLQHRELMLEGVIGIAEGMNPQLIRIKLDAYLPRADRADDQRATT